MSEPTFLFDLPGEDTSPAVTPEKVNEQLFNPIDPSSKLQTALDQQQAYQAALQQQYAQTTNQLNQLYGGGLSGVNRYITCISTAPLQYYVSTGNNTAGGSLLNDGTNWYTVK